MGSMNLYLNVLYKFEHEQRSHNYIQDDHMTVLYQTVATHIFFGVYSYGCLPSSFYT